jgi:peptidoglycan hydrolase-like protein with peptidoglycan-binding domain
MIEAHAERDLASPDIWAASLERSLARRRRPRRTSIELSSLRGPRDLTEERVFQESREFAFARRRVADQLITMPEPAARKLSIAAMTASVAGPGALAFAVWHELTGGGNHAEAAAAGAPKKKTAAAGEPTHTAASTIAQRASFYASFNPKADAAARPQAPRPQVLMGSVSLVQQALGVHVDGVLGPKTVKALKDFQSAHGLKADAVVGQATWAALSPRLPKQKPHARTETHKVQAMVATAGGSHMRVRHGGVRSLQQALGLSADGVFGPKTERALKRFQQRHGLTADGVAGPDTRRALGIGTGATLHQRHLRTHHRSSSSTGAGAGTGSPGGIGAMIAAANRIATLPYIWGGGHGSFVASGYDCSGSVSYVLHAAGLLATPEDSSALEGYGLPGPGRYVTIYANAGHAWMTIDGRRFDTSGLGENGSRWAGSPRSGAGFVVRHPPGY